MLQGLAAAVLLTSCLNLANMMLAFGSARQKEIAIRLAVGGARSRIVRQLLVQGLMLSLAGGVLGLVVATWAAQLLVSSMATVLPITLALDLRPDTTVLIATLIFCTLATLAFGLWPALRLSRPDLLTSLKDQAGEVSGKISRPHHGARRPGHGATRVVAGAAGAERPVRARRGRRRVRGSGIPISIRWWSRRSNRSWVVTTRSRAARRSAPSSNGCAPTPGIESVAAASVVPFGDYSFGATVQREGPRLKSEAPEARRQDRHVLAYTVTSDYFKTLGLPMVRGREFTAAEEIGAGGTAPVVIDQALVDRLFPNEDPIGQLLQYGANSGTAESKPMLIVGVAPPVKHDLFESKPEPHIYTSSGASDSTRMFVYARAAAPQSADTIVVSVREQLRAADANLPVIYVKTFRSQHEGSAQVWILRAAAKMFLTLGLAAAFVAVIGLYGVRSYLVTRRTREFGVRMAIGASPVDVLRLVLRESIVTTAVGLTIGLGLGILLGWGLSAVIYQISPFDPITLGGATGIARRVIDRRVADSGATRGQRAADDGASERLTIS